MFYATRMKDARGSYFKLLDGYTQLREGMVNGGGSGDNLSFGRDALRASGHAKRVPTKNQPGPPARVT